MANKKKSKKNAEKNRQRRQEKRKQRNNQHSSIKNFNNEKPETLDIKYENRLTLAHAGPLIYACWSVPIDLKNALESQGKTVPESVFGHMLVDTGAANTAIATHVVEKLNLIQIGTLETKGAHGAQISNRYLARCDIFSQQNKIIATAEKETIGIPDMDKHFLDIVDADGEPIVLIGLLGRDFLSFCTMTYNGIEGKLKLQVHTSKMNQIII